MQLREGSDVPTGTTLEYRYPSPNDIKNAAVPGEARWNKR